MFSVVIPYYKKIKYIERCLDSVLHQTFQEFEIVLVDDGSNDDLKTILASPKYQEKVRLITQANQGVSIARNNGIKASKHDYIAFLDADDLWHFQYLEFVYKIIVAHPNAKIVGAHYSTDRSKILDEPLVLNYEEIDNYFRRAIKNTLFTSSSSVILKSFFEDHPGFNPSLRSGQDIDVWFRTVLSGGGAYFINNTMMFYSTEDGNQVSKQRQNLSIPFDSILLGNIPKLYYPLYDTTDNEDFKVFISKYIYFNLYEYFYSEKFHEPAKELLKHNKHKFFLLELLYKIPFSLGCKIIQKTIIRHYMRLYLKFVLRYIYK